MKLGVFSVLTGNGVGVLGDLGRIQGKMSKRTGDQSRHFPMSSMSDDCFILPLINRMKQKWPSSIKPFWAEGHLRGTSLFFSCPFFFSGLAEELKREVSCVVLPVSQRSGVVSVSHHWCPTFQTAPGEVNPFWSGETWVHCPTLSRRFSAPNYEH